MWATYYFQHALGVAPEWSNIYFGIVALTSPVSGAISSGWIINWFGGFYAPIALPFCIIIGVFGITTAWLVPFTTSLVWTIIFLWVLLFIGAIILPICTGVCLTKVEPELRPRANSIANLCYNLLGYFPAPAIYGFAVHLNGRDDSVWGMATLMFLSTFMIIFIFCAIWSDPKTNLNSLFKVDTRDSMLQAD